MQVAGQSSVLGVFVSQNAIISAGGNGAVNVQGTLTASSPGAGDIGVESMPTGTITSSGGNIVVTGTISQANNQAISLNGLVSTPAAGGNVTLVGDNMNLNGTINVGTQSVTLIPQTNGTPINLAGLIGHLVSTPTLFTAGTLNVANASSGTITVSSFSGGTILFRKTVKVNLTSGGDIVFNTGSINTDGGSLTLTPGINNSVQPLTSGTDATVTPASLAFGAGSNLAIAINGTTVDTQYNQLSVLGDVNLTGVNLVLSGSFARPRADIYHCQ